MSTDFEGKNLVELLDMLEPVPVPQPISLIPQTPGWVVLGLVVIVLVGFTLRFLRARYRANAYRRAALKELALVQDDAAQIATLLRRTALAGFPRRQVAGLIGVDWLNFLDQTYGGTGFSSATGQTLLAAPYQNNTTDLALTKLARDWITGHKKNNSQIHGQAIP